MRVPDTVQAGGEIVKHDEYDIQCKFVQAVRQYYPDLLFTISPQSMKLPMRTAVGFSRLGYRKGTPDVTIHEPRGKYHGLFIEFKSEKGKLTKEQQEFKELAEKRGYCFKMHRSASEAFQALKHYLCIDQWQEARKQGLPTMANSKMEGSA